MNVTEFDIETMTIGELVLFEDMTGITISEISRKGATARVLQALALISLRRDDPSATVEDANSIRITSIMGEATEGDDDVDPTTDPAGSSS